MADYEGMTRTSYFRVKSPKRLKEILKRCSSEGTQIELTETVINGKKHYSFCCESCITGLRLKKTALQDTGSYSKLISALQSNLYPGEAMVIMEVGHEKLRYLVAAATVITKDACEEINLCNCASKAARKLLGNPNYTLRMEG